MAAGNPGLSPIYIDPHGVHTNVPPVGAIPGERLVAPNVTIPNIPLGASTANPLPFAASAERVDEATEPTPQHPPNPTPHHEEPKKEEPKKEENPKKHNLFGRKSGD
jgi:hypothetical protein